MKPTDIDQVMRQYVAEKEMPGGALYVQKGVDIVYEGRWGFAKKETGRTVEKQDIYRMMSLTKCITAVAVMICVERGLLELDAPLSDYLPEFSNMRVVDDERYAFEESTMRKLPWLLLTFSAERVKTRRAERKVTIRDLLSHSSGIQQGLVGLLAMMKDRRQYESLSEYVSRFADQPLDFEPGTGTGYSPAAGFDILG